MQPLPEPQAVTDSGAQDTSPTVAAYAQHPAPGHACRSWDAGTAHPLLLSCLFASSVYPQQRSTSRLATGPYSPPAPAYPQCHCHGPEDKWPVVRARASACQPPLLRAAPANACWCAGQAQLSSREIITIMWDKDKAQAINFCRSSLSRAGEHDWHGFQSARLSVVACGKREPRASVDS